MGRQGPLTSQALGRSPYADVVEGTGEPIPGAPPQQYDDRGRPTCPRTKELNKDVIRSHNEVMQVIGVAEADDGAQPGPAESAVRHMEYEDRVGSILCNTGRVLEMTALWGINGTRLRILLYKQYAQIPFQDLFRHEWGARSLSANLLAGLPSFVVNQSIRQIEATSPVVRKSRWIQIGITYVRLHLEIYIFMQRIGLMPAQSWLPHPLFFVPFTTYSPLPPLPTLSSMSSQGLLQWAAQLSLGVAPFAVFFGYTQLWQWMTRMVWTQIYDRLPKPSNPATFLAKIRAQARLQAQLITAAASTPAQATTAPPTRVQTEPTTSVEGPDQSESPADELRRLTGEDLQRREQAIRALEGQSAPQPSAQPPVGAVRRQSTFSTRGDDYNSDDEETEVINATLISFDVEQTESADTPPGIWAAELRPSISDPRNVIAQQLETTPVYRENALTILPAILATDTLAVVPAGILIAPLKALALRTVARAFLGRWGSDAGSLYSINPFQDLSVGAVVNFLGLEMVHLLMQGDIWAMMTIIGNAFRLTEEEWNGLDGGDANSNGRAQ